MNRQARVLLSFISSSNSDDFLALRDTSAPCFYYQRLIYSLLSHSICTAEGFESLGRQLGDIARHAYLIKQVEIVEQASQIMLALPLSGQLRNVARHYQALCAKQRGDFDTSRRLLESVIEESTPHYKARALQVIGATYYEQGEPDAALPFYIAAGKAAINCDLPTLAESQRMIAIVRSIHGDHKQALKDIENLFPLVRVIAKRYPMLYYSFLNSLAVELSEVGRIKEARNVCQLTLVSPFTQAHPELLETRDEIETKRTDATPSIVAVSKKPEAEVQTQHKVKPVRLVAFIQPTRECVFVQRSVAIVCAAVATVETTTYILDRVRYSIIARGPPACC